MPQGQLRGCISAATQVPGPVRSALMPVTGVLQDGVAISASGPSILVSLVAPTSIASTGVGAPLSGALPSNSENPVTWLPPYARLGEKSTSCEKIGSLLMPDWIGPPMTTQPPAGIVPMCGTETWS